MVHKLLQRQLEKAFGSLESVPEEISRLVQEIDAAYRAGEGQAAALAGPLARQVEGLLTQAFAPGRPVPAELQSFLEVLQESYVAADLDRALLLVSFEITSRRLLEAIRQQQQTNLERQRLQERLSATERLASLGTLAAGLSHEINNPLAFISANLTYLTEQLASGDLVDPGIRDECKKALEDVRTGTERIGKIVHHLKLFSTPGALGSQAVDVGTVLDLTVEMLSGELMARARLTRDFGQVRPVAADGARLGQVFLHLVRNALQAIERGAPDDNEVRLVTRMQGDRVIVEVSDTGAGIAPAELSRVFDPFFTTRTVGEGQGLGLSICHGIVTSIGGQIEAQSEVGRGSVFRVSLPAAA